MEVAAAKQLLPMPTPMPPPPPPPRDVHSPSSSTSSSSPSSPSSYSFRQQHHHQQQSPIPRVIDTTPFPTTFVQADTASFKQVVQMLTGSTDAPSPPAQTQTQTNKPATTTTKTNGNHPPVSACRPKKPAFKLYDRRGLKNLKMIAPLAAMAASAGPSPRKAATTPDQVLSPSVALDFPSLALGSPVTPLVADPSLFNRSSASSSPGGGGADEERAAIASKGFYLHPSPRSAAERPRLLPLFPVTSPRTAH